MNDQLPENFRKILVVRRDNIGDLLCTTPLLHALRQRYPDAHIAVLANSYNADILTNNPDINVVYRYTKAKHSDGSIFSAMLAQWRLFRRLRREHFDLVIHANPVANTRTGKLIRYLGVPHSIGVEDTPEYFSISLSRASIPDGHHVEQVYALLRPLGIKDAPGKLVLRPGRGAELAKGGRRIIGVHLSSRKPCNRWPLNSYVELISILVSRGENIVVFWAPGSRDTPGHPGDDEMADEFRKRFGGAITLKPTETLFQLVDGINETDIMICPDGGTLHIAAALQKPVVALFGCSDARVWKPWMTAHRVLIGHGSAENISVDEVLHALAGLEESPDIV